jgi:hypothetical protein
MRLHEARIRGATRGCSRVAINVLYFSQMGTFS